MKKNPRNISTRMKIRSDVPQGSVVGPLLFFIYNIDLPSCPRARKQSCLDDITVNNACNDGKKILMRKL